eukprot:6365092-Prymnesium_polylepis.2
MLRETDVKKRVCPVRRMHTFTVKIVRVPGHGDVPLCASKTPEAGDSTCYGTRAALRPPASTCTTPPRSQPPTSPPTHA